MEEFFDKFYACISYIGLMPKRLVTGLLNSIKKLIRRFVASSRKAFSSSKILIKRIVVCLVIASIIGTTVYASSVNSTKVPAFKLTVKDEVIGYASTKEEAELSKNTALKVLGSEYNDKIDFGESKTDAYLIETSGAIAEKIVDSFSKDLIPVTEIYINGELYCAVEDGAKAKSIVKSAYEKAQKSYPSSTVAFSEDVTFKPTYYAPGNENIFTPERISSELNSAKSILKLRRSECEEKVVSSGFETVEVQTNKLFKGDKRVRRTGQNGASYQVNLVTYVDNKPIKKDSLMTVSIKKPVTQIIERGIRAETLTLGTHTVVQTMGVFCWPVVDLFQVTSPFGPRSLGFHRGIDISGANAAGSLVVAAASGTVTEAGWSTGGYGNYVKIDHGNGVETLYAHMLDNSLGVTVGDVVTKGQILGQVGNTGYSFGAHLHFEVRINGTRVDPAPYLGLS